MPAAGRPGWSDAVEGGRVEPMGQDQAGGRQADPEQRCGVFEEHGEDERILAVPQRLGPASATFGAVGCAQADCERRALNEEGGRQDKVVDPDFGNRAERDDLANAAEQKYR